MPRNRKGRRPSLLYEPMKTDDPYLALKNLSLLQRQAGVDPEISDLVCAYARIKIDSGQELDFTGNAMSSELLAGQPFFRWLFAKNNALDPRFLSFLISYSRSMAGRRLPVAYNTAHLAHKQKLSKNHLLWMAYHQKTYYAHYVIPKANGSPREIDAPSGRLLAMQQWILRRILNRGRPHKYATAFIKGRSIMDNGRPHAARKVVVRIDLKDFFPSITYKQVRKVFEQFGYPYRVAGIFANLCTLEGRLPQGAPTSPALSNLVCVRMDRRFAALARKSKFRYTRYADDLVFSSNNPKFPSMVPFLKEIIRDEGFTVNEDKLKIMHQGQRQAVTGLVVNAKPNLKRDYIRRLRAIAHRLKIKGITAIRFPLKRGLLRDPACVLQGHMNFLAMVCPSLPHKLFPAQGVHE